MENLNTIETIHKRISIFLTDKDWKNAIAYCEKALDIEPENSQTYIYYLLAIMKKSNIDELINHSFDFSKNSLYKKAISFANEEEKDKIINIYNEHLYIRASKILDKAKKKKQFVEAIKYLETISEYKNSKELISNCQERLSEIKIRRKKNIKYTTIAFISVLIISIIGFISSFLIMENTLKKSYQQIEILNEQKISETNRFAPTQEILNPTLAVLESKKNERSEIIDKKTEVSLELAECYNLKNDIAREMQDDVRYGGHISPSDYATYSACNDLIEKYKKEIDDLDNKIAALDKEVSTAQTAHDAVILENKSEVDKHNDIISMIDNETNELNNKINKINQTYKIFPYTIIVKIFK